MGANDKKLTVEQQLKAQQDAYVQLLMKMFNLTGGSGSSDSTQSAKTVTKLTTASARALLQEAGMSIQYTQDLTDAEVQDFIKKFDAEQKNQIEQVVKSVSSRVNKDASPDAVQKEMASVIQTEYPSFFKPAEFAKNYLWTKVNFGKVDTLGGKNIQVLQQVQQAVKDFNLLGYSDAEALAAAKDIAMGKKSIDDFRAELSQIAIKEYPNLAARFQATPGLSTKDIASPVINMLAKEWEVDPNTIGFDNPIVAKWLRPTGADGKETTFSYTDALREARNDPKWQSTTAANELARNAATSLIRAFTGGV